MVEKANTTNYNKSPYIEIKGNHSCYTGWDTIIDKLKKEIKEKNQSKVKLVVECYQGVILEETEKRFTDGIEPDCHISSLDAFYPEEKIKEMVYPDVTDDRIFGYLSRLNMEDFIEKKKQKSIRDDINSLHNGIILIFGPGASLVCDDPDILVYADMARWEIQQRMRSHLVDNLGVHNRDTEDWMLLYKNGFFVDWRVCDRLKKKLFEKIDFVLDTNDQSHPKMLKNSTVLDGYRQAVNRPFSVVPFFDPGPWGGQWMKQICGLDKETENYAWCFNCVPEENSLMFKVGAELVELPSINLVFRHPVELLGDPVHARFGDEFPIRFDFLDTMDGGNLSLQVHPLTEYIQEKFGMHYTQDESYYMLDAKEDTVVYLGFKENVCKDAFMHELKEAQSGGPPFIPEKHVNTFPVKKHDHFLIPAGTIHCSGKDSMVLEISATPYIFTFKLWDWGRLGLDGQPRPINIGHGESNLKWDRMTRWVEGNLVNRIVKIDEGDGWKEERTGLHEREFIETRRHWFSDFVEHDTGSSVNVLNLVEGEEAIVESPDNAFDPFIVHYAETFIVPACVGKYTIRPYGPSEGNECATVKAFVRYNP